MQYSSNTCVVLGMSRSLATSTCTVLKPATGYPLRVRPEVDGLTKKDLAFNGCRNEMQTIENLLTCKDTNRMSTNYQYRGSLHLLRRLLCVRKCVLCGWKVAKGGVLQEVTLRLISTNGKGDTTSLRQAKRGRFDRWLGRWHKGSYT